MSKQEYIMHSDAGHGWLEVNRQELIDLGIEDKISEFSYQKDNKVYLEEDCDASLFLSAIKEKGQKYGWKEKFDGNTSPIRKYDRYSK